MKEWTRRPWLQFSLRSLLLLMLVTAAFFGGRTSLRPVVDRLRLMELEARRAQEGAVLAEQQARYMADLARAQMAFAEAMREGAKPEPMSDTSEPGVPNLDAVPNN